MEKNTNLKHRERLRQKYLKSGLKAFHDYEIIELLLTYCIPYKDTKPIAKALLLEFNDISGIFSADLSALMRVKGIGERTASFLKMIRDTGLQIKHIALMNDDPIKSPGDIVDYYKYYFARKKEEEFCVVYLNNQNRILSLETEFSGDINKVDIYIRKLVARIIDKGAKNIIILHNHPGGSLKPSLDDNYLTFRLAFALRHIESSILDHIIISHDDYYSFSENGQMSEINKKIEDIEKNYL